MKRKLLFATGITCGLILTLFVVLFVAERAVVKPVLAQVRAALTQNIDEPGRNSFAVLAQGSTLTFGHWTVPAGKRYVVQNYSAFCEVAVGSSVNDIELNGISGGTQAFVSAPVHYYDTFAYNIYVGTGQGPLYLDPNTDFYLSVEPGAPKLKDCSFSVTGYAINNP